MNEPAFFITVTDMFTTDANMVNIMKSNGLKTRGEFWDWLAMEYGAYKCCSTARSKQWGYASIEIKFPSKSRYVEFCLKWM